MVSGVERTGCFLENRERAPVNAGLVLLGAGLLLSALVARTYSLDPPPQAKACGPPLYSCSRTDLKVTQPDKAPMIDFGGLKGANSVLVHSCASSGPITRTRI